MRLDELIKSHTDVIIDNWQKFAGTLGPSLNGRSTTELHDHIQELLDAIIFDMTSVQSADERKDKSQGIGSEHMKPASTIHADTRFNEGFKITEMVSEYRALRASVLSEWAKIHGGESHEDITRFNEAIDESISVGIERFTASVNMLRDQFLAILIHDLRNPLSAIITSIDLFQISNEKINADNNQYVNVIKSSAMRMLKLIDDLLDFTRSSLGVGIPITPAPIDLKEVCLAVVKELQVSHPGRAFHFQPEGDLCGKWDEHRLAQVISNLIGNALQYGSALHAITIKAKCVGESVILEVHNVGSPIDSNQISQIFDPMYRSNPTNTKTSHLGLGLFIVREIVKAHKGEVTVTSNEKEGTTFSVRLPHAA